MTVKAIYENGVLRPTAPLALKEHEEVELEIKTAADLADEDDPRSFVGFITNAPAGVAIARDHDQHLNR